MKGQVQHKVFQHHCGDAHRYGSPFARRGGEARIVICHTQAVGRIELDDIMSRDWHEPGFRICSGTFVECTSVDKGSGPMKRSCYIAARFSPFPTDENQLNRYIQTCLIEYTIVDI